MIRDLFSIQHFRYSDKILPYYDVKVELPGSCVSTHGDIGPEPAFSPHSVGRTVAEMEIPGIKITLQYCTSTVSEDVERLSRHPSNRDSLVKKGLASS